VVDLDWMSCCRKLNRNKNYGTAKIGYFLRHARVSFVASRYKTDGAWQTFIDYDKFHEGFRKWQADGTPLDVSA